VFEKTVLRLSLRFVAVAVLVACVFVEVCLPGDDEVVVSNLFVKRAGGLAEQLVAASLTNGVLRGENILLQEQLAESEGQGPAES
jgi:hypothetical protein